MPVEVERRERVTLLTLSRPEALNAMSAELLEELDAALVAAGGDPDVGAVVITGAGEKAFSAGADIRQVHDAGPLQAHEFAARGHRVCDRIESLPRPVIAAINGYALGGGCEIALACDLRLAAATARIGLPEVNIGIFPGWGGTQRLPRLTSPGFAKGMIFTGRQVPADEALAAGLVNAVHPPEELLDAALALAAEIAAKPALALAAAKAMIDVAHDGARAGLARELERFALMFSTDDQKEGMTAFLERREARFTGR